ncbi:Na(+)/H(+) antiporter subunit D [Saccharobesus litoralis]|uniref:Na(+)/H(+) antiporter subunit D n=1 Tax=Saccharobesus litoralis TaxID=2172099 RepID=A0A2S0VXX3_9ALTE|nr:Na(+)/H(+) antiporter subunit D [Saccharobesus litoralis]
MMIEIPPGWIIIAGAFILAITRGMLQKIAMLGLPLLALVMIWSLPEEASWQIQFFDYQISLLEFTATGKVFATVFALMTFVGGIFAMRTASTLELCAAFLYAGSAIGVTSSGDLISLFVYWEIMALGSTAVVLAAGTVNSYKAAMRYLLMHAFSGSVLMVGIAWHIYGTGSAEFSQLSLDGPAQWMILIGFLVNAGAPPFSAWIADAYPEASPSGCVFLSAFTTKTSVFALLIAFPGTEILIPIGCFMIFYGIIYALLENDARRILSYSIVNQVGFMVVGIGIGTEMALNGATAHAFAHIVYKALLLMSAGAVLYQTGKRRCSDLGGLYQSMPLTTICGTIGALAISSFPFTSGFISKSMISSSAAYEHLTWVWFLLAAASAGVFLHAGIKYPWFVFFQKDSGLRPSDPPKNMQIAMVIFAVVCIALGVFPQPLYDILPFTVEYVPYTADHLVTQFQLLLFAGLAFFLLLPMMKRTETISLDFDWVYRRLLPRGWSFVTAVVCRVYCATQKTVTSLLSNTLQKHYDREQEKPLGYFAKLWPTETMVVWVAVLLAVYLVLYYI